MNKFNLVVISNEELKRRRSQMCRPYKYFVEHGCSSHAAFETKQGLRAWLYITGLKYSGQQPRKYFKGCHRIDLVGDYSTQGHFKGLDNIENELDYGHPDNPLKTEFYWLTNARYRPAKVEKTSNGHIIHYDRQDEYRCEKPGYKPKDDGGLSQYFYYNGLLK